jgi:hypothetical protein
MNYDIRHLFRSYTPPSEVSYFKQNISENLEGPENPLLNPIIADIVLKLADFENGQTTLSPQLQEIISLSNKLNISEEPQDQSEILTLLETLESKISTLEKEIQADKETSDNQDRLLESRERQDFEELHTLIFELSGTIKKLADSQTIQVDQINKISVGLEQQAEQSVKDKERSDQRDNQFLILSQIVGIIPGLCVSISASYIYNELTKTTPENPVNKVDSPSKIIERTKTKITTLKSLILDLDTNQEIDIKNFNGQDLTNLDMSLADVAVQNSKLKELYFKKYKNYSDFNKIIDTKITGLIIKTRLLITLNKMESILSQNVEDITIAQSRNEKLIEDFVLESRKILIQENILDGDILINFEFYITTLADNILRYPSFLEKTTLVKPTNDREEEEPDYYKSDLIDKDRKLLKLPQDVGLNLSAQVKTAPEIKRASYQQPQINLIENGAVSPDNLIKEIKNINRWANHIHNLEVFVSAGKHSDLYSASALDDPTNADSKRKRFISYIVIEYLRFTKKFGEVNMMVKKADYLLESDKESFQQLYTRIKDEHQLATFVRSLGVEFNVEKLDVDTEKSIKNVILVNHYSDIKYLIDFFGKPVSRGDGMFNAIADWIDRINEKKGIPVKSKLRGKTVADFENDPTIMVGTDKARGPLTSGLDKGISIDSIEQKRKVFNDVVIARKIETLLYEIEINLNQSNLDNLILKYFELSNQFSGGSYKRAEFTSTGNRELIEKYLPSNFVNLLIPILAKHSIQNPYITEPNLLSVVTPYCFLTDFDILYNERPSSYFIDNLKEKKLKISNSDADNIILACNYLTRLLVLSPIAKDPYVYHNIMVALSRMNILKIQLPSLTDSNPNTPTILTNYFLQEINFDRTNNRETRDAGKLIYYST